MIEENQPKDQYIGFFHTGAYQESLGGYGGIQHCLIPAPKHVLIDIDEKGDLVTELFADEQDSESMLQILGYGKQRKAPEPLLNTPAEPVKEFVEV